MSVCKDCGREIDWLQTAEGRYIPVDPAPEFVIEGDGAEHFYTEEEGVLSGRLAQLNGWAVAWYVFLAVAGVLMYKLGAAYALRERGYYAVGGEALALLLPVFYYCAAVTVRDIIKDWRERR